MKKIFCIFALLLMLLNCGNRDSNDESVIQPKEMFNPPSWIYGKWGTKNGTNTQVHYVFNENNIFRHRWGTK